MKKIMLYIVLAVSIFVLVGCQAVSKKFGGTITINLPAHTKLINITWKDSDIWYLTREMTKSDTAVQYKFSESSNFGLVNGLVIVNETK